MSQEKKSNEDVIVKLQHLLKSGNQVKVFGYDLDTQQSELKKQLGVVPQEFNFNNFEKVIDILTNQADADVTATVKVLTVAKAIEPLLEAGFDFIDLMKTKAQEFNDVVKTSRASLRDGLPVCLGDEFEGYACTMKEALGRLSTERSLWKVSALGLGEAGTGLGSTRAFQIKANEALSRISALKCSPETAAET